MAKIQVRECFVPRAGNVFIQADYEQIELHTLAELCKKLFGFSELGNALNAGLDPHTELAAEILEVSAEEARRRRKDKSDKEFDNARQNAKEGNFGFPGGMGVDRFCATAESKGIPMPKPLATRIRKAWMKRWPEVKLYFDRISALTNTDTGTTRLVDVFTGRVRGDCGYTNGCNDGFQGLAAAIMKEAIFIVQRACYLGDAPGLEPGTSPLLGCRTVNSIHDELICEAKNDARAHYAAKELERLMVHAGSKYLSFVKAKAPPLIMGHWSKNAEACTDEHDLLVPWDAAPCSIVGCTVTDPKTGEVSRRLATRRIRGTWFCGAHAKEALS